MPTLFITNGDHAAELLADAGCDGLILPWRDILHEGPIVAGPIERCSGERAPFLATRFGLPLSEVTESFRERDAVMRGHEAFERIELWFEHDLYDQLQLLQILSFFAKERREEGLVLVQADDFLGRQRADTVLRFADRARSVDEADLETAEVVWADLAMPTPDYVFRRMDERIGRLPFLAAALQRFIEELPDMNGVTRTEFEMLRSIKSGIVNPRRLFAELTASEPAAFLGDLCFFALLDDLAHAETPLIAGPEGRYSAATRPEQYERIRLRLTDAGSAVLGGETDHVRLNGIDRWWGGTRLEGRDVWRYNRDEMTLVPPGAAAA